MSYFRENEQEIRQSMIQASSTNCLPNVQPSLNQDVYGYRLIYNIINNLFY